MIIRQLTNNNYADYNPAISGNNIAWIGFGDMTLNVQFDNNRETEIFYYNGTEIIRLTDNDVVDINPDISDTNIAWASQRPHNSSPIFFSNIYLFDGNSVTELTYLPVNDIPKVSGYNVVWDHLQRFSFDKVVFFDGNQIITLGHVSSFTQYDISNNQVVWTDFDWNNFNNSQILLYNGIETQQITNNNIPKSHPRISGNKIVWQQGSSYNETEIFFFNGNETIQITDNNLLDENPQISENNIIWQRNFTDNPISNTAKSTSEIIFYNGTNEIRLTNNDVAELNVQMSGNNVVWQQGEGNESEIFVFNGSRVIQLTNNNVPDQNPEISGDNIVWQRTIDESDITTTEIFTASLTYTTETETESYLYRFRNTQLDSGTYLFVNDTEANTILTNPNYDDIFELEGGNGQPFNDVPAFKVSNQPEDNLIGIYRLRSQVISGTYLFVTEGEYNQIFADNSPYKNLFIPEGLNENRLDVPDFYVYSADSNLGTVFNRLRNVQNNTYLFAGESETNAILNDPNLSSVFAFEGSAFEGLI